MELFGNMNIVDIVILIFLGVSLLYGMYRGFISGVLSLLGLIAAIAGAFTLSPRLAAWLSGNETLVATLLYYTDAASRIGSQSLSMLPVSQVTSALLSEILGKARLPSAFESAFIGEMGRAAGTARVSSVLSQTIVSASISILSFLICFLACYLAALFVVHLISYVFEFPVLRHLDALVGGLFGLLRGYMVLVILFMLVPIVLAAAPIDALSDLIDASRLAPYFDSRLIFSILGIG